MRQTLLLLAILVSSVSLKADRMMDIMRNYDAKTLTTEEMDETLKRVETKGENTKAERYKLEYKNEQKLFRRSFFADYYLVDTQKNDTIALSDTPVRDAVMSPNGKYVVYAKADNNLYIYKVDFKTEVAITNSEAIGDEQLAIGTDMYNGISDWLYEEEFGVTGLFAFSPDNKQIAFVRLDEKEVPTFEWQTFLGDEAKGNGQLAMSDGLLYPELHSLRYPKAGEANAKASVCVYDIHYKTIRTMQLPDYMDGYIPRIGWTALIPSTKKGEQPSCDLVILHLNRDQNRMDVLKGNPKSTVCHPFYKEESKKHFVNFEYFDEWQWLSDNRVIVVSEKGGYAQAYLYNSQGVEQKLLTPEKRDITDVYGFDEILSSCTHTDDTAVLCAECEEKYHHTTHTRRRHTHTALLKRLETLCGVLS